MSLFGMLLIPFIVNAPSHFQAMRASKHLNIFGVDGKLLKDIISYIPYIG